MKVKKAKINLEELKEANKILKDNLKLQKEINKITREYLDLLELIDQNKRKDLAPNIPSYPIVPTIPSYPSWINKGPMPKTITVTELNYKNGDKINGQNS